MRGCRGVVLAAALGALVWLALLRQARTQARTFADASGTLTLAQLTTAARQLAGGLALLAQTLMDVELLLAWQEDDGAE